LFLIEYSQNYKKTFYSSGFNAVVSIVVIADFIGFSEAIASIE